MTVKISSNSPKELIDKYAARIGKLKNEIIFVIKSERPYIDASLASLKNIFNQLNCYFSKEDKPF